MKKFAAVLLFALAACSVSHKEESNKVNGLDSGDYYKQFTSEPTAMQCKPGQQVAKWPTLASAQGSPEHMILTLKSDGTFVAITEDTQKRQWDGTWKISGVTLVLDDVVNGTGLSVEFNGDRREGVMLSFPENEKVPKILQKKTLTLIKSEASFLCN